jgi:hypothetical protein
LSNEYISFYEIAKEMILEENLNYINTHTGKLRKEFDEEFRSYRKSRQKNFENILKIQGINPKIKYKSSGEFKIPIEEKEIIKLILREYSNAHIFKLRNKGISTIEDVEKIVKEAEKVIMENYKGIELANQLSILYGVLEYHSKKTGKEVYERITKLIYNAIDNIKIDKEKINPKKVLEDNKNRASYDSYDKLLEELETSDLTDNPKYRFMNDYDAEFLIKYLEIILTFTVESWNKLVDTYSELREENIEKISLEMIGLNNDNDIQEIYASPLKIFESAMEILYNDTSSGYKLNELSRDEIENLGKIIESIKSDKE